MDDGLMALAGRQHGLLTTTQLGAELSWRRRNALVAAGNLVPIGRRTFRIAGAPRTERQTVLAACMEVGGVASGCTAAWIHGLGHFGPGRPPSIVAKESVRDYRIAGSDVHSSTHLGHQDVVVVGGIPTLNVARTLFSLAAMVPELRLDVVANAVDEAVRDGKATDAWLRAVLQRIRCRGRNGVSVFERILDARVDAPTESLLEREFLRVVDRFELPRPLVQARIEPRPGVGDVSRAARVDFLYERACLVVEVTGHGTHSTVAERCADARRRNGLAAAGFLVVEFTYQHVIDHPAYVAAELRDQLRPRPDAA